MKIHYHNAKGEETFIDDVIHLQNVDNYTWVALLKGGKELTLRTDRIEGIADMHELGVSICKKITPTNQ